MNKFPWTQYLTTLLFYLIIAVVVYMVAVALPRSAPRTLTAEQAQNIQKQQAVERTKLVYQQVLTAVGKLMVLPNTLPQISVVQDAVAFVQQNPVFAGSQAGDILLVYPNQIIVYSPKYNRIVHSVPYSAPSDAPLPGTNPAEDASESPEPEAQQPTN